MYIKQIILEGFKSYGERTVVEPFHPGHTVIIGKNGAGKSNFFAAIQFLLNNELFHLSDIQKQGFLFDSSSKKVITASVEIIFDNSDHSLPFDKDEVSLRRVIGLKKDQYFLNRKLITRNDLTHLIESPGLSGSNPYYIVQQGQINKVAMEPKSRLKLLYEIAGANVFESKKKDSTILLKAAQSKIDEIQECLLLIDEHIQELQVKMDDFKEFKILDRTRRTIEHVIFDHQLEQYKKKLKKMEEEEQTFSSENMKLNEKIEKIQKTLKDNNKDHKKIAKTINNMNEELRNLKCKKESIIKNKLSDCNEELRSIDQKLKSMVGTNIMIGKNSIDKVLQTFKERPDMANKVNMYLGLVIEIFTCDPECYKAVEVVAGNRLFYHVVQKKSFGSELLMEMNRQKLPGEVTFIPLDGINPHIISLPTDATCRPLLDTLIWDNKYRTALQDNNVALENKLKLFKQQLRTNNENLISKKRTLQDNEINLDKLNATKINLQNELLEDFSEKMSSEDEVKLRELSASINELSQKYNKVFTECNALETEKIRLSNLLDNNLIRQRDMMVQELNQISIQKEEQMLKAKEKRLVDVKKKIDEIITDIVQQKNKVASTLEMYKSQSLIIENTIITENEDLNKQKEENDRKLEKFMSKIKLVKENIETILKKRDELGTIPSHELYQKYYHSKTENLFKILERTKNNLKNYSDINQKALEQFEEFTNRRDELKVRVEESLHEYSKIEELIFVLQQRKDEAIALTFDQVGKNFSEIFNKLVPMGRAELVMKTSNLTHDSVNSLTDSEITERYVGIDVQVTFTGRADETTEMEHLSGGQKSLIALVLIFAIHKFRPAPFYLFDEIDQALDTEYRKAVAEMIHELSHNAQLSPLHSGI
ncbi:unnamed protein product [Trichogramma brassicae]|uniref:Structural maintenance of chromosomes protein 3 n=1 Tax=Trichogramma brassicae TaxID=86971 RepID=A0A6H5I9G0_9HYME|nr:unnamed protein product [Trichogramma brassicae]